MVSSDMDVKCHYARVDHDEINPNHVHPNQSNRENFPKLIFVDSLEENGNSFVFFNLSQIFIHLLAIPNIIEVP